MLKLRIIPPGGQAYDYESEASSLTVGRSSAADVALADPFLSRQHARFFRDGETWYVEDLGSRNTTRVNGVPVERPLPLRVGDVVKMSGSLVHIQGTGAEEADRPAQASEGIDLFRSAADLIRSAESSDTGEIKGEAALRRYADRLKLLNEVHRALCRTTSVDDLLALILERAFSQLHPEEGAIFLKTAGGDLSRTVTRQLPHVDADFLYSRRLVAEVAEKGLAALVSDALIDERFATADSVVRSGVRSLLAAPLLDSEGVLGMIVLGSRAHVRRFSEDDLELLVSLASVAALRLRNAALMEEALRRRQLERDLALAREVQISLLQRVLPALPGYALRAGTLPSRTVSGDFYKIVERAAERECLFMVVDVAGKGLGASLLTASLEALSAGPIDCGLALDELCATLSHHLLLRTPPERYATMFVGVLKLDTGRLKYASAGHNPTLIVRQSGPVEKLTATGIPLGLLESTAYRTEETPLDPGDLLLVYTDGLTEANNAEGEEYGLERLTAVAAAHRHAPLDDLQTAIERDLDTFVGDTPYADDRTLLMLKRLGGATVTPEPTQ